MTLLTLLSGPSAAPPDVVRLSRTVRLTKYVRRPRGMARAAAALLVLAGVSANQDISVPVAGLTLDGYAPTVSVTANQSIAVPVASLALDGYAPTVTNSASQSISVPVAGLTLASIAPTVSVTANQAISVPVAGLALAGIAPTVESTADDGFLSLVRKRPAARDVRHQIVPSKLPARWLLTLVTPANQAIGIPTADLALQAYAPSVTSSSSQAIAVPVAALTLAGQAPTVAVTGNQQIAVPVAGLTLSSAAPTVAVSGNQRVDVPVAGMVLAAHAPTVDTGFTPVRLVVEVSGPRRVRASGRNWVGIGSGRRTKVNL